VSLLLPALFALTAASGADKASAALSVASVAVSFAGFFFDAALARGFATVAFTFFANSPAPAAPSTPSPSVTGVTSASLSAAAAS